MSKRTAVAKQRIQQFYFQLTDGCGRSNCTNPDCASNPNFSKVSSDSAAARAMVLFKNKVSLCDKPPSKVPRTDLGSNEEEKFHGESSTNKCGNNKNQCHPDKQLNNAIELKKAPTDSGELSSNTYTDQLVSRSNVEFDSTKPKEDSSMSVSADNVVKNDIADITSKVISEECIDQESIAHSSCDDNISKKLENIFVSKPPLESGLDLTVDKALSLFSEFASSPDDSNLMANLKDFLWKVYSNPVHLNTFSLTKEDFKSQQSTDEDKDVDEVLTVAETKSQTKISMDDLDDDPSPSSAPVNPKNLVSPKSNVNIHPTVDMEQIKPLHDYFTNYDQFTTVMLNAIAYLNNEVERQLIANKEAYLKDSNYLNMFVMLMENPVMHNIEAFETVLPKFCRILSRLPYPAQAALVRYWAKASKQHLRSLVENMQQLITIKVVSEVQESDSSLSKVHVNDGIVSAAKCLNVFYYASILAGTVDKEIDQSSASASKTLREKMQKANDIIDIMDSEDDQFFWVDPLGKELGLNKLDSVEPLVPLEEFVNEPLNDVIMITKDYANFKINQQGNAKFSLLHCPFLLNTENKTTHLFYDNRITMYSERQRTMFSTIIQGELMHPYLKINVRRNHIIEDALIQLEYTSVKDFKKQLFVEFDKEEGVDEGGVSKEFFQLIIDEIFNPENGVFVYDEDTRLFWFNSHSFEASTQYKLIGIVFGLAIYNNCILNVKFPSLVYKKLLGRKARFADLEMLQPVLYKSLLDLLEYQGNVEEDLMVTFQVEYQDVFGNVHQHDLKEDGNNKPVTNDNRQEYVDLYVDWLLNTSIAEQFNAFLSGFDLVVSNSPIKYLFNHRELELLITGSEKYDFDELQRTTEYDGGFTATSQTIVDFWSVVHELSEEEKRNLLQFSTGSDRAPVGGLAKLKMIIARNGPDSNRLPTAHTCFNVIILPDYKNREKLKERLLKAIKYSKGFGML